MQLIGDRNGQLDALRGKSWDIVFDDSATNPDWVRQSTDLLQVRAVFGEMTMVVRPSYIVGPGDTSDRFPYWPVRLAKGGDVLAPGKRDDPVAFIDVRDLAEFMVKLA